MDPAHDTLCANEIFSTVPKPCVGVFRCHAAQQYPLDVEWEIHPVCQWGSCPCSGKFICPSAKVLAMTSLKCLCQSDHLCMLVEYRLVVNGVSILV